MLRVNNSMHTRIKTFKPMLPQGFEAILELPFKNKTLGKYKKSATIVQWVLHKLYGAYHLQRKHKPAKRGWLAFTAERMAVMAKGDRKEWPQLKDFLVNNNLVECDGTYCPGKKAMLYRLKISHKGWHQSQEPISIIEPVGTESPLDVGVNDRGLRKILECAAQERGWESSRVDYWHSYLTDEWDKDFTIGKTGRVFARWNLCPSDARKCLTINGKETSELDISNSQPLLLSTLYAGKAKLEYARYLKLVQSGKLYEDLQAKGDYPSRKAAKEAFIEYLFGSTKHPKAEQYLERNFPYLAALITAYHGENHKKLARVLQTIESDIVVNQICGEFPAISIHDGVRVPSEIAPAVKVRFEQIFKEQFDLQPTIKVEQ